jgi:hypothetical protein
MPDDAVPRNSRSGLSTASWATQVLRCNKKYISAGFPSTTNCHSHRLLVVPVFIEMRHVFLHLPEKRKPCRQPRVLLLGRDVPAFEPEVSVKGQEEGVQMPVINWSVKITSFQCRHLPLVKRNLLPPGRQVFTRMWTSRTEQCALPWLRSRNAIFARVMTSACALQQMEVLPLTSHSQKLLIALL